MSGRTSSAAESWRADLARYREDAWLTGPWWIAERSIWAVAIFRLGQRLTEVEHALVRRIIGIPYAVLYAAVQAVTGIEIPPNASIGPGLRIYHGQGLVINAGALLGSRVVLRQGVTIGARRMGDTVFPVIGDRVEFGAYAQVFGNVRVGDDARIGSLTLVVSDVEAATTAVGIPYRPGRSP